MNRQKMTLTLNLSCMHCPVCGEFCGFTGLKARRIDGRTFWCPSGHGMHFDPAEIQRELEVAELTRLYGPTPRPTRFAALRRLVNTLATKGTR